MNLKKCENGHYYDADKLLDCPYCVGLKAGLPEEILSGKEQSHIPTEFPNTIQIEGSLGSQRTVGWLVVLNGMMSGKSFPLWDTVNHIGSAPNMDIELLSDPPISRTKHATITYDPEHNLCILSSESHKNQTFLNGKAITGPTALKDRDIVSFGICTCLFVALCRADFSWKDTH